MNKKQLQIVVENTLHKIPHGYSVKAVNAIMMIIAHESLRGEYIMQVGGPALGLIQMEPETHADTWLNGDTCKVNMSRLGYTQDVGKLVYDIQYQVAMARQRLFMKPDRLPSNLKELSKYLKKHWNSTLGDADEMSYYKDFIAWQPQVL